MAGKRDVREICVEAELIEEGQSKSYISEF
jgi:hypothetical protein